MTIIHKALMMHYVDGSIIGHELRQLLHNSADAERFDRDMAEDPKMYRAQKLDTSYRGV